LATPTNPARTRRASVARTLEILSDSWTFLVIREALFGVRRYQGFQAALGIPRSTLTSRLDRLIEEGIFRREHYQSLPERFEYRLTEKGLDLYPSFIALMRWGDRWLSQGGAPPLALFHRACGRWIEPRLACSHCGGEVRPQRVSYRPGPGAGPAPSAQQRRNRRSSDPGHFQRGRDCSVARALQIIGDRWSFLIIREGFFGVRRFDELQENLGIAPNILSDRLQRLVGQGVFDRVRYQERPDRFEYRFAEKGKDLYGSMIVMGRWGDRWLSADGPPLLLRHLDCGHDFEPVIACDRCGGEIAARDMSYASTDRERERRAPRRAAQSLASLARRRS
jgi:DNA-binding HxlR family transcriptional regulator